MIITVENYNDFGWKQLFVPFSDWTIEEPQINRFTLTAERVIINKTEFFTLTSLSWFLR